MNLNDTTHYFELELDDIHPTALIGLPPQMRDYKRGTGHRGVYIKKGARIGAFCSVDGGWDNPTFIGRCYIMKSCHIGHDVVIGDGVQIAPMTSLAGYVELGENVKVGQGVVFKQYVKVGANAVIGMGAVVTKDVPAGATVVGNPARNIARRESDNDMWRELYERQR